TSAMQRRLQKYNHEQVFANDDELSKFVKENGWLKFKELKRVQKGGYAIYYYCKAIKWMDVRCRHMMLVVKEDNGLIVGKTTDGGQPHEHHGMRTPKRGPKPCGGRNNKSKMRTNFAVQTSFIDDDDSVLMGGMVTTMPNLSAEVGDCSSRNATRQLNFTKKVPLEETSQLLTTMDDKDYSRILNEATPRLLQKMKEAYEERKRDQEREAAAIFTNASPSLVAKMIQIHTNQNRNEVRSDESSVIEYDTSAAVDLFTNASPELISTLKQIHERKKQQEEETALKLFTAMTANKQRELLHIYYDDSISALTEK
uniref:BESS domain-containing protein n=1 Tax=Parascaris univalens TaxID=6257 RepID=A0A915AYY2_PARUN